MFRKHHQIKTGVALVLALAALAPAAASARLDVNPPPATTQTHAGPAVDLRAVDAANPAAAAVHARGARVARELAARDAAGGVGIVTPPPAQIVKVSQPTGFAWGDAGVGAAAVFGLILVLLGSTLYVTHRRTARLN